MLGKKFKYYTVFFGVLCTFSVFFGKTVKATEILSNQEIQFENSDQKLYDTIDISYPNKAKGWRNGVYYRREQVKKTGSQNMNVEHGYLVAKSKMWSEKAQVGRDISYYESGAIVWQAQNADYDIQVDFENPTDEDYQVFLRANDSLQSNKKTVRPGKTVSIHACVSVVYSKLELSFIVSQNANSNQAAEWKDSYIKKICIQKRKKEKQGTVPTIYIAGDSISATRPNRVYPREGWGQEFYRYIRHSGNVSTKKYEEAGYEVGWYQYKMNTAIIENRATSGESTGNFRETGKFDSILNSVKPGDYVIMMFGANDERKNVEYRSTSVSQYKKNLLYFINGCKQRGAGCILVSPIPRWRYTKEGKAISVALPYRKAMKEVAASQNVLYLNLGEIMDEMLTTIGQKSAKEFYMCLEKGVYPNYPEGFQDASHLTEKGAKKIAQVIASEIKRQKKYASLANMLKCEMNYYKGLVRKVPIKNITQKKGNQIKITWKKIKHARMYTLMQYNEKKKKYIAVKHSTTNNCIVKKQKKNQKYCVKVQF